MNYHLNRNRQDLGIFPLEELRQRRASGELSGAELVWCEGMPQWQSLESVLFPERNLGQAIPSQAPKSNTKLIVTCVLTVIVLLVLIGGAVATVMIKSHFRRLVRLAASESAKIEKRQEQDVSNLSALEAAQKPVMVGTNSKTFRQVQTRARDFRMRQYIEGYKTKGYRNPTNDAMALDFLGNWLACNYGGKVNTNLPSLNVLADRLAEAEDLDPLVLSLSAVNTAELHESIRRLERAVKGFETSKHRGYPKFYATVTLEDKLVYDREDRLPVLDALAVKRFKEALADGSLTPSDQEDMADILIDSWGKNFFWRNYDEIYSAIRAQGKDYDWLALVLNGSAEINRAWKARGSGFVDSVTDKGWKEFGQHLAIARRSLTQAWQIDTNKPFAPARMIYVSLGDGGIGEMRLWFDRTVAAQIDYPEAWRQFRWGLRLRWYGDQKSILAFGITALNTKRFDTDVPKVYFDSVHDLEDEEGVREGDHIFGRADIWPHFQQLYEGYLAEPSQAESARGWHNYYAIVAFLGGKFEIARKQFEALNWQTEYPNPPSWGRDLSDMPLRIAGATGTASNLVMKAESRYDVDDLNAAMKYYQEAADDPKTDSRTQMFLKDRMATIELERQLKTSEWIKFMPVDTNFTGWHVERGEFELLPDGSLLVKADSFGHLIYSRAEIGTNFEVRGQFEVINTTNSTFQAGLVMGLPHVTTWNWDGFRIKQNDDEKQLVTFSANWSKTQIMKKMPLDEHKNSFIFRYQGGKISATVNNQEVFNLVPAPNNRQLPTNTFMLGLGAFSDSGTTVIRYRNIEARKLSGK